MPAMLPQALLRPEQERMFRLAWLPVGLSGEARLGQLLAWQPLPALLFVVPVGVLELQQQPLGVERV